MRNFKIFTESKFDSKFIRDYFTEILSQTINEEEIGVLGSWSGYKTNKRPAAQIQENHDNRLKTVLILDADNDFHKRQTEIVEDFRRFGIDVELFLFPDNQSKGNLETVLSEIAVNRQIMDCFLDYEKCVNQYPKPLNDARIYTYLDMLLYPNAIVSGIDLRRSENINYLNKNHWDLHHPKLNSLKNFLTKI